jgi:uracil-DNA glycosylase
MGISAKNWKNLFDFLYKKQYFLDLLDFLDQEYDSKVVYPEKKNLFNCFSCCSEEDVKVVIIGQDPYHEPGQAHGLSFSVQKGIALPPSLKNIYKEIENEYGEYPSTDGDLTYLAEQGVLLLNKYLTVVEHKPLSHKSKMYDNLFVDIISFINKIDRPIVYLLWGKEAQKVEKLITNNKHFIIKSTHPSPLGANKGGWFNTNLFKNCNSYLIENKISPIQWVKKNI